MLLGGGRQRGLQPTLAIIAGVSEARLGIEASPRIVLHLGQALGHVAGVEMSEAHILPPVRPIRSASIPGRSRLARGEYAATAVAPRNFAGNR